jgi:hypothetical protein
MNSTWYRVTVKEENKHEDIFARDPSGGEPLSNLITFLPAQNFFLLN